MLNSTYDFNQLDQLIREIVRAQKCTSEQVWQLGNFYEQAKVLSSQGNLSETLIILSAIRRMPELDPDISKLRSLAEGYADALYVVFHAKPISSSFNMERSKIDVPSTPEIMSLPLAPEAVKNGSGITDGSDGEKKELRFIRRQSPSVDEI